MKLKSTQCDCRLLLETLAFEYQGLDNYKGTVKLIDRNGQLYLLTFYTNTDLVSLEVKEDQALNYNINYVSKREAQMLIPFKSSFDFNNLHLYTIKKLGD